MAVTWAADIFEIIVYASKAFVLYYGLQAATAAIVEWRRSEERHLWRLSLFAAGIVIVLLVIVFGRAA